MIAKAKHEADIAKALFRLGKIGRDDAHERIAPYINEANRRGEQIAKKYGMRHRKMTITQFMR